MSETKLNNLHIRLLSTIDGDYKKEAGLLYLTQGQSLKITIAEYDDELKSIEKEFKQKEDKVHQKKRNLDRKIAEEREKSLDFINKSTERYYRGKISLETHNANIDAREKSMDERANREKDNEKTKTDSISAVATEKEAKITVLKEKYKNIRWICHLTGSAPPKYIPSDFNFRIKQGKVVLDFEFNEFLEGGGPVYIEPYFDDTIPRGKAPHGFFIRADGSPDVLAAIWEKPNGEMISGTTPIAFGSSIYLSIFTQGLYGQTLKIALKDKDNWLRFSTLGFLEADDKLHAIERAEETTAKGEEVLEKKDKVFSRPVDVHLQKEKGKEPKGVKKGELATNDADATSKENDIYVQKCYFRLYIDPLWKISAGKELKIYPIIYSPSTGEVMKNYVNWEHKLWVSTNKDALLLTEELPQSNQVAVLSNIETNIGHFSHCRYDKVLLREGDQKKIVIFDVNVPELRRMKTLDIDIIAGENKSYTIDFDLKTIECIQAPSHHHNEIQILSLPQIYSSRRDEESFEQEELDWEETEETIDLEEVLIIGKESKTKTKTKTEVSGLSHTEKNHKAPFSGEVVVRNNQIALDAFYYYDIPDTTDIFQIFPKAMNYFKLWKLEDKVYNIKARASSCAFTQDINIRIYPDIKWTLQLGFNVTEDLVESLNKKGIKTPLDSYRMEIDETNEALTKEDKAYLKKNNHLKKITYKEANDTRKAFKLPKKPRKKNKAEAPIKKGKIAVMMDILQNINISLAETHYDGKVKNELSAEMVKKIYNTAQPMLQIIGEAFSIIEGDKDRDRVSGSERKNMEGLMDELKRKPTEYEVEYPQFALASSWFYEQITLEEAQRLGKPALMGRQGIGFHMNISADPLIGISIKWDLLELICRRHPIAYAILKAVDAASYMLDASIKLDFIVRGQISSEVDFSYNSLAGFKNLEAMGKQAMQMEIKLEASMTKKWNVWKYGVVVELGFGLSGKVGIGLMDKFGLDSEGLYIQKILEFEGITLKAELTAQVKAEKKKDEDDREEEAPSVGKKWEVEITMLDFTFATPKFHLTQK